MQIVLIIVLLYLLYRFVVGFVLPVATAASRLKKQFREMQGDQPYADDTINDRNRPRPSRQSEKQRTTSGKKGPKEDYIDFEEVPSSKH